MSTNKKTKTEQILMAMPVLAWVAFVAFAIEAGAVLISFGVSYSNPESAKNLYRGLDLFELRSFSFWYYTQSVSLIVSISVLKSYMWLLVIKTLSKFNLNNPFTMEVAKKLEKVSYVLFSVWLISMLSNAHRAWLLKVTGSLQGEWISGEFIFIAGLVFIISQIFKRGVEIQEENELTV